MELWAAALAGLLAALLANGAGFLLLKSQRKKNQADAAGAVTDAAVTMMEEYRAELRALKDENKELKIRVDKLERRFKILEEEAEVVCTGARKLEAQVVSLGQVPVFNVPELYVE